MESEADLMGEKSFSLEPIDPKRDRFPCCIVWTPLPVISWLLPFIGHIGICREDGVILDFAGPNFVCVDNFAFGAPTRYIQLKREKCCLSSIAAHGDIELGRGDESRIMSWDDALRKSTQEFQHRSYSLFTCNCHSFVANNMNRLCYKGNNRWNVVNLAIFVLLDGTWVNKSSVVKTLLPFVVVVSLGLLLGGSKFLVFLVVFGLALVGWFMFGTYCFKNLIQL